MILIPSSLLDDTYFSGLPQTHRPLNFGSFFLDRVSGSVCLCISRRGAENMERWRKIFKGAGPDICSVIEYAIVVAASDYPTELRAKRDSIAERLFTCTSVRGSECESGGAGNDSDSEAQEEEEENKVTGSSDAANGNIISNLSYVEAEALTEEIEEQSQFVGEVNRIKEILRNPDESESHLYESLRRLELMQLSVEVLKVTKVGRQVSRLKGHGSNQIRSMAELLLRSWENLVDEWVKTAGDIVTAGTSSYSVSGEGIDEENGLPAPPLDEGAFFSTQTTPIEMSQFFDGMDDDGNPQIGNGLQGEENDPNETDRENNHFANQSRETRKRNSSMSRTSGGNVVKGEFRSRDHFQRQRNHQSSQLNGSALKIGSRDSLTRTAANSGPRRPQNGAAEHRDHRNNVRELTHVVKNETRPSSSPPQSKSKSSENASVMEKIEASKRRLQKGYQQAENAKKQRTIQVMDLQDLPKQGPNHLRPFLCKPGSRNHHFNNGRRT